MTANESLDKYLRALPRPERVAKVHDLLDLCKISHAVLHNWRCGRSRINIAWQDKITEIIGENIFANTEFSEK